MSKKNHPSSKFQSYKKIRGVGAASGLIYENGKIYIISDDSDVLYVFDEKNETLEKISLLETGELLEHRPKPEKSDYEAITADAANFYIFGSGSTSVRNRLVIVNKKSQSITVKNLDEFYGNLKIISSIDDENLNIEGAILSKNNLYLFNRGNGPKRQNGIFKISDWQTEKQKTDYFSVPLPPVENSVYGFTDAILAENKIYFLATAEAAASTYEDGEVLGSLIGGMDFHTLKIEFTTQITKTHKLEGITLFKKSTDKLHFLLCEDPDEIREESEIFEVEVNRK